MSVTISIFCTLIHVNQNFKTSKLLKFVKNGQKRHKICKRFLLNKTNKKCQKKTGVKCFVYSQFDITYITV